MKTSTIIMLLGITMVVTAIVTGSHGSHFFALPQDQDAMDAYLGAEGRRDLLAVLGSLMAVLSLAVKVFHGHGPQVCSKHTDPGLRDRANQMLRDAGCNVFDPTNRFDDILEMELRLRREYAVQKRLQPVLALAVVALALTTTAVIESKWSMVMVSWEIQVSPCDQAHHCTGIDWNKLRTALEAHEVVPPATTAGSSQ